MKNVAGRGPTEQNQAIERMRQERASPGATSAGGHGAAAPDNDTRALDPGLAGSGAPDTSAQTDTRRGNQTDAKPAGAAGR